VVLWTQRNRNVIIKDASPWEDAFRCVNGIRSGPGSVDLLCGKVFKVIETDRRQAVNIGLPTVQGKLK